MRLTPADVHNVAFKKPSIGKRGYDEDEVDAFLDLVENELSRLIEENNELTGRLSAYESGERPAETVGLTKQDVSDGTAEQPVADHAPETPAQDGSAQDGSAQDGSAHEASAHEASVQDAPDPPAEAPVQQAPPAAAPQPAAATPRAPADHHVQAARLLGLAEETAQRLTSEAADEAESTRAAANAESEKLLTDSQGRSEKLLTDSQGRSEKMLSDAQGRSETMVKDATEQANTLTRDSQLKAEAMDREAQRKYGEVMTQLTEQRTALEKKIDDLRTYEREYRSRLKGWITEQLSQLDEGGASANGGSPQAEAPHAR